MKKLLLTLLTSLVLSGAAWAEWVRVGETDDSYHYIDPVTIRKDGNLVRAWEITDLKQRGKDGGLSIRERYEYDCKQERYRAMSISQHSGAMAGGNNMFSYTYDPPSKWVDIPPNTISDVILKIVCVK